MRTQCNAEWRRISPNFLSNHELPGADLLNLQGLVLHFFRDRAIDAREELRELNPRVGEVTEGFMRQAQQIRPLWDCMCDTAATGSSRRKRERDCRSRLAGRCIMLPGKRLCHRSFRSTSWGWCGRT